MEKAELRTIYRKKRLALSPEQVQIGSEAIAKLFFEHFSPLPTERVHVFLPIEKWNEVNTNCILNPLKEKGIPVAVPKVEGRSLVHIALEKETVLAPTSLGILEPLYGQLLNEESLDYILVPLLVFDQKGYRIGYGGGYYDRFLARCKKSAKRIGLSLLPPFEGDLPIDPWDVPLDCVITPERLWRF